MISYQCFSILLFIGIFLCSIQADDEKDLTPRDKKGIEAKLMGLWTCHTRNPNQWELFEIYYLSSWFRGYGFFLIRYLKKTTGPGAQW